GGRGVGLAPSRSSRWRAVGSAGACVVAQVTPSWTVIAIAAEGFTVASIETYKTFFFPNRPRGKFAGKPIRYPRFLETRRNFVPLYAGIWAVVIIHAIWGLDRKSVV